MYYRKHLMTLKRDWKKTEKIDKTNLGSWRNKNLAIRPSRHRQLCLHCEEQFSIPLRGMCMGTYHEKHDLRGSKGQFPRFLRTAIPRRVPLLEIFHINLSV